MHLVNSAKSSKSIFEFIFVHVITEFFLKTQGGNKKSMPPSKGGKGAVKYPAQTQKGAAHPEIIAVSMGLKSSRKYNFYNFLIFGIKKNILELRKHLE